VGYDRPSLSLGPGQAGAGVAAPIWANYQIRIAAFVADDEPHLKSVKLTEVLYCRSNGLPVRGVCSEPYKELFLEGTGPETGNQIDLGEELQAELELPLSAEKKSVVRTKDFFAEEDD
jgi:membrane carboxypeptidase/penicillin-binding protein